MQYNFIIRISLIATLLLLVTTFMFAQEDSTHIVLKNGGEMNVVITKVDPWGCTLSDDRMLLFKIMGELHTKDTLLVQQVITQVDSIKIRKKGDIKILDLQNAIVQKMPAPRPSGVGLKTVTFDWTFDYAMNYGFQLSFSFRRFEPFIIVPGIFFGNTLNTNYATYGASLGVGCMWEYEKSKLMLLVNYSERDIEPGSVKNIRLHPIYLSIDQQFLTGDGNKYMLFVGGTCNLNHVVYDGNDVLFSLRLGIGFNLSVIPFFNSGTQ